MSAIEDACRESHPLRLILRGGNVMRYHTEGRMLSQQSVAEHTWRVLATLLYLWPDASIDLIKAVIYHDAPEGYTGDVPALVKMDTKISEAFAVLEDEFLSFVGIESYKLSFDEQVRLKYADLLEVALYMEEQPETKIVKDVSEKIRHLLWLCQCHMSQEDSKIVQWKNMLIRPEET